jgi:FdhE protein
MITDASAAARPLALAPMIGAAVEGPFLRLPDVSTLYARRAERLYGLALDHPMADYLRFVGDVVCAQHKAAASLPPPATPDTALLRRAVACGAPPFSRTRLKLDPAWIMRLNTIINGIDEAAAPSPARHALKELRAMSFAAREKLAHRFLSGEIAEEDLAQALFVGAALAVYWAGMVRGVNPSQIERPLAEAPGLCPICGSLPVASVLEGGSPSARYLHCSLCDAEWRYVRVKCANCQSTANVAYLGFEGEAGPMRAECCGDCGGYLKILNPGGDPDCDAVADDLATLGLDYKLAEEGSQRYGYNPFLLTR